MTRRPDLEKSRLTLGFIPLTDCAPLVVAQELGYFRKYGLAVTLSQEHSWASIRDKVGVGLLDGAQMLAAMPLAASLGLDSFKIPMMTALGLDLNGNAITVSNDLWSRMVAADSLAAHQPVTSARALQQVIAADRALGRPKLIFAMVFPFSSHHYLLRHWLASGGIDPDTDVEFTVIPPPRMVHYLNQGGIDGYCVGAPWNALAVQEGLGRIVITGHAIWNNHLEKVFGVNRDWAERHPNTHQAVVMALLEACRWLDQPENRLTASQWLARGCYVAAPAEVIALSLTGKVRYATDEAPVSMADYHVFHRYAANFPWHSQGRFYLDQMQRWGQLRESLDHRALVEQVYRPDLYRQAAAALDLPYPTLDDKAEGLHAEPWTLTEATRPIPMGPDRLLEITDAPTDSPASPKRGWTVTKPSPCPPNGNG